MKIQSCSLSNNNRSFQAKIVKTNSIEKVFQHNQRLLDNINNSNTMKDIFHSQNNQQNKNLFTEVASFCRSIEAIFEIGTPDKVHNLTSQIKKTTMSKETYYSVIVRFTNFLSILKQKTRDRAESAEICMLNNAIIEVGKREINSQLDKFAEKQLENYIFQNLDNLDNVLSDYGKDLWKETQKTYKKKYHTIYYNSHFANILKAKDELKAISSNDTEKNKLINEKIKSEIKTIIKDDYKPIHNSYIRISPQILNCTKKDFREFYTGESKQARKFRTLLEEYNRIIAGKNEDYEIAIKTRAALTNLLQNWLNKLKENNNLINQSVSQEIV